MQAKRVLGTTTVESDEGKWKEIANMTANQFNSDLH